MLAVVVYSTFLTPILHFNPIVLLIQQELSFTHQQSNNANQENSNKHNTESTQYSSK